MTQLINNILRSVVAIRVQLAQKFLPWPMTYLKINLKIQLFASFASSRVKKFRKTLKTLVNLRSFTRYYKQSEHEIVLDVHQQD